MSAPEIVDAAAYHADPAPKPSLSCSIAKLLIDATPLHAWHAHPKLNPDWQPPPPKKHLDIGSAGHKLLLGEGPELAVIDAPDFRTKAAQQARDEAYEAGRIPILTGTLEEAQKMIAAAWPQLAANGLEMIEEGQGDAEVTVIATDPSGAMLRSRLDWANADRTLVVDYKTTMGSASEIAFAFTVARMGYDIQDAFYQHVLILDDPSRAGSIDFVFVVQELAPPYALATYQLSEADRHIADRKVQSAIKLWNACLDADRWPGYPSGVQRIALPEWHMKRWLDREMEQEEGAEAQGDWIFAGR